jgi:NAD(P)-dependent dehydrogenase (short-subunit alcohol dehydrogenase family)
MVTGGTSGVGQAIARSFAREGSMVIALDRLEAEETAKEMDARDHKIILIKINDEPQVKKAVDKIAQEWGRIDILINNFRLPTGGAFLETNEADWHQALDFNLMVPLRFCGAVLPYMVKQQYGRIVNVGSIAGRQPRPVSLAYSAAMAGVISITRSLAVAMARHNVRVNGICTGPTDDPVHQKFIRSADPAFVESIKRNITLGRWGKTEEVAAVVLFLASDEASYIVGQSLSVDGGNNML